MTGTFAGNELTALTTISTGSSMLLNFQSDPSESKGGFVLQYETGKNTQILNIDLCLSEKKYDVFLYDKTIFVLVAPATLPPFDDLDPCNAFGKIITDTVSGFIESPGWPDEHYPNSKDCKWTIEVDNGLFNHVELKIISFDLESR